MDRSKEPLGLLQPGIVTGSRDEEQLSARQRFGKSLGTAATRIRLIAKGDECRNVKRPEIRDTGCVVEAGKGNLRREHAEVSQPRRQRIIRRCT